MCDVRPIDAYQWQTSSLSTDADGEALGATYLRTVNN